MLGTGFAVSTSDWGSSQMIAYRVILKKNQDIHTVLPFYDQIELHAGGISAVEQALSPAGIEDAQIEKYPSYKLMVHGGLFASFFLGLGTVLEKVSNITKEERKQPLRAAKTH